MSGAELETTHSYELKNEVPSVTPPSSGEFGPVVRARDEAYDGHDSAIRQKVWDVKSKLDSIPFQVYNATRDEIFPTAHCGTGNSVKFKNRAGHKLNQSMEAVGVWDQLKSFGKQCAFADVCGGPGSFSQALYVGGKALGLNMKGYGMTLMFSHPAGDAPEGWYPELYKRNKFISTFGVDGTGNIYVNENVEALRSLVATQPLRLVVADGGFDLPFSVANYQEVISNRIVYGQWYCAVKILIQGGCFVLKLFDTFSPFTRSLLYLSLFAFDKVHIVKPKHSRVVNSERYLVCVGFKGLSGEWMAYLDSFHKKAWDKCGEDDTPMSVVPMAMMEADKSFMAAITEMNSGIAEKQEVAIEHLLNSQELKDNKALHAAGEPIDKASKRKRSEREAEEAQMKAVAATSIGTAAASAPAPAEEKEDDKPAPPEQRAP